MTKFQALFVKYLATRMVGWSGFKGESYRNIAMYYFSRYPETLNSNDLLKCINTNKKWWQQDFITSQIDGLLLIDEAATVLDDFEPVEKTNWQPHYRIET